MNAVIDEDLPRSFASVLASSGFHAFDIRDHGLRGTTDITIFRFAQSKNAVLFTADLGFANIFTFPLGKHFGICVLRFPNELSVTSIYREVRRLMKKLRSSDYRGNLIILSPGKIRIRRHLASS